MKNAKKCKSARHKMNSVLSKPIDVPVKWSVPTHRPQGVPVTLLVAASASAAGVWVQDQLGYRKGVL